MPPFFGRNRQTLSAFDVRAIRSHPVADQHYVLDELQHRALDVHAARCRRRSPRFWWIEPFVHRFAGDNFGNTLALAFRSGGHDHR